MQFTQHKYIRFCLKLNSTHHIGTNEFKEINLLPAKERVEQHVTTNVFKYQEGALPFYVN